MRVFSRSRLVIALACGACSVVPNPDYGADAGESGDASDTSEGEGGPSTDDAVADDGTTAAAGGMTDDGDTQQLPPDGSLACGENGEASGGECPPECDECVAGLCRIDCDGPEGCKDSDVACPAGWPCLVQCVGREACRQATIVCSYEHGCQIACDGESACNEASVVCGGGTCDLECAMGKDVCKNASLRCGTNMGRATCMSKQPELDVEPFPASMCGCELDDACRG